MCCTSKAPVSAAEGSFGSWTKCADREKRSTMVSTTVLWSEGGRPVTKSKAMWDQGRRGVERGCRSPAGAWWEDFPRAHMVQAATNSLVWWVKVDHQNCWQRRWRVRATPRVACQSGRVGPLQDLGAGVLRDEQDVWRGSAGIDRRA